MREKKLRKKKTRFRKKLKKIKTRKKSKKIKKKESKELIFKVPKKWSNKAYVDKSQYEKKI